MAAKSWFKVGFQDQSYDFRKQFVAPNGHSQRALLSILTGNIHPSCWFPPISFISHCIYDGIDLFQRHPVWGLLSHSFGHRSCIPINFSVRDEIEISVEELSVDAFDRQPLSASLGKKVQIHLGVLHCAYLLV